MSDLAEPIAVHVCLKSGHTVLGKVPNPEGLSLEEAALKLGESMAEVKLGVLPGDATTVFIFPTADIKYCEVTAWS